MARIIVEQTFLEPLTDERYSEFSKTLDPCMEVRNGLWRRSSLSLDRLRLICEFEAPDAEAVREALRSAGIKFDRVWTAQVFAVEDHPELMTRLHERVGEGSTRT
jgi:hypothetical protein